MMAVRSCRPLRCSGIAAPALLLLSGLGAHAAGAPEMPAGQVDSPVEAAERQAAPANPAVLAVASRDVLGYLKALRGEGLEPDSIEFHAEAERQPAAEGSRLARVSPANLAARQADVIDYRLMMRSGRASVGVGFSSLLLRHVPGPGDEMRPDAALAPPAGASPEVGLSLRYQLSGRSGVYVDSRHGRAGEDFAPRLRVGMEFKSTPNQFAGLARGTLMRVQLSAASQVSLRWRGGKVGVVLRSQF